jgi:allantoin racemase
MTVTDAPARLLLINGNSRTAITERLLARARALLGGGITAVTASASVPYVETPRDCVLSAAAVVGLLDEQDLLETARPDIILMACFGEPGIEAVRDITGLPVLGMLEASVLSALQFGTPYAIITPGVHWPAMLAAQLRRLGLERDCRAIHSLDMRGLDPARDREALAERVATLLDRHDDPAQPTTWIIGGAALSGLCGRLAQRRQQHTRQRLLDAYDAALGQVAAFRLLRHAQSDALG